MQKTDRPMKVCIALLILNLIFIWGNSLLPGWVSKAFSGWVKDLLGCLFLGDGQDGGAGHDLLRKLAHLTEFLCLGMCLCWLFSMLGRRFWLPLLCGFLVACTDELIQCLVPDRGPGIKDVMIDTFGVLLGICVLTIGFHIYKKRKTLLEETST